MLEIGEIDEILWDSNLFDTDFSLEEQNEIDQWTVSTVFDNKENVEMENALSNSERPGEGRFKCLNMKQLDELEEKRQFKSTKKHTQWGLKVLQGNTPFLKFILDTLSNIQNNTKM